MCVSIDTHTVYEEEKEFFISNYHNPKESETERSEITSSRWKLVNDQVWIHIQVCVTPKPGLFSLCHTLGWALLKAGTVQKTWMLAAFLRMWPRGTDRERGGTPGRKESPPMDPLQIDSLCKYLLLDPVGAPEELYRMHFRIGHPQFPLWLSRLQTQPVSMRLRFDPWPCLVA